MTLKAGAFGLALSCLAGTALAENVCAGAKDLTALQVAAVQQELMVAALTCNEAGLYNSFVLAYQRDLQESDRTLLSYFRRAHEESGTADYHSFKTRLANHYSLKSLENKKAYCRSAEATFASALNDKLTLASFALSQPASNVSGSRACGDSVTGVAMVARPPEVAKPVIVASATVAGASATVTDTPPALKADPPKVAEAGPPPAKAPGAEAATPPNEAENTPPPPPPVRNATPAPYAPPAAPNAPPANRGNTYPYSNTRPYAYGNGNAYAYGDGQAQSQPYRRPTPPPPLRTYRYDARERYACETYYGRDPYRGPYGANDPCYQVYRWYDDRDYYRYGTPPQQYWRR
ncbi:MAG TPA: hypothetical protein VEU06_08945 [Micropepsaceae bacterium]|nr:hypothetical protein [Micropepsaceae bacterium]